LTGAAQIIAKEIAERGAISFAEFMRLALYCPVYGYYEREEDSIGRDGDYYTSVSVGPLFGELLAFRFAAWLGAQAQPQIPASPGAGPGTAVQIVEAGAHGGQLARDVLTWLGQRRPELFERLGYWIIEPSERRRRWQQQTLREHAAKVRWAKSLSEVAVAAPSCPTGSAPVTPQSPGVLQRIIFANELLDAFPVHRLGWDAKHQTWFEWGVGLHEGGFVWTRLSNAPRFEDDALAAALNPQLAALLPDGFSVEVCPAAMEWWRAAASVLGPGKLLTIDYGLTAEQILAPERTNGTLRAYHRHQVNNDVLANPGAQDITAHVNFSALQAAGESVGLQTEAFLTQAQFLTHIAAEAWKAPDSFGDWTPKRTRQFQTLTHPEFLGRPFRVLVQGPAQAAGGSSSYRRMERQ
jgi:SAM-dependent MidA family methyltransferase